MKLIQKIKENKIAIIYFLVSFVVAFCIVLFTPKGKLENIIDKFIFRATPTFVAVAIAITGIFYTAISNIYLNFYKVLKSSRDTSFSEREVLHIRNHLDRVVKELRDNTQFIVGGYFLVVLCFFLREIDLPYVIWFVEHPYLSKVAILNSLMFSVCFMIFIGIWDSIGVVFKIVEFFKIYKEK